MNIEELREYCLDKKEVTESFPFDARTLVFKVCGKMFALINVEEPRWVNLKCEPEYAEELRAAYEGVDPGYHMNKRHWNSVSLDSDIPDPMLRDLIDRSYRLVVRNLPKKDRMRV